MAKRYLGGGVSFEQKDVYQEFSEDPGGGGSSTLSGLTDVDITNPADGQTLVYNASAGKWENGSSSSGSGPLIVNASVTHASGQTTATFDKTFAELKSAYEAGAVMLCHVITEDNDNSVYGSSIAFLGYYPAVGAFPASFSFEASFLMIESGVHGCYVTAEINADRTSATIHVAKLAVAN